jgi:TPR repeat protein
MMSTLRVLVTVALLSACAGLIVAEENHDIFNKGWYAYTEGNYEDALKVWLPLAEAGDVYAQYYLGELYRDGMGDMVTALGWFDKAAAQRFAKAQNALGNAYLYGEGATQDDGVAFEWYQRSAIDADVLGQAMMGWMYENGRGTTKDIAKSLSWYRLAANQDDEWSQTALGRIYNEGKDVEIDNPKACYWYEKAAEQGDGFAKYRMGYCYAYGWGRKADQEQAVDLFQQAIDRDIAEAVQPLEWYADDGNMAAQYTLAKLYSEGHLVDPDDKRALSLAGDAADQGHAGSLAMLGSLYLAGKGVEQDEAQAEELLLKAALQNGRNAKVWLARLYARRGKSNSANVTKALVWSKLASFHDRQGHIAGMLSFLFDEASMVLTDIQMEAEDSLDEDQAKAANELFETWERLFADGLPGVMMEHLRSLTPPDAVAH